MAMSSTTLDLFADHEPVQQARAEQIGEQSWLLRGFALPIVDQLLPALDAVLAVAPLAPHGHTGRFQHVCRHQQLR